MTLKSGIINLFIDGHSFDKEFQGTRTFIRELYHEMAQQTDQIAFYIGANNTKNLEKEFASLKNVHFIQYSSSSAMVRLNRDIPKIIKQYKIHFAHFQYIAPFRKYCRYIVTTHDILFNDFKEEFSFSYRAIRNILFRYSIKRADIKTTVSAYSKERISYYYSIPSPEIHVVKNGVSEDFYKAYDKTEEEHFIENTYGICNYILYVSRLEPRKNHILLLRSYLGKKLYEKGISLVFIGRSTIADTELENTINSMPQEAKIRFFRIDQVDNDALLRFYRGARLFVYPSKAEGFGIPPLEAGAMKIPVLCSDKTAMSDFTFFGDRFFDPQNKSDFEHKLDQLLFSEHDPEQCQRISDKIKEDYSWSASAKTMLDLILNFNYARQS